MSSFAKMLKDLDCDRITSNYCTGDFDTDGNILGAVEDTKKLILEKEGSWFWGNGGKEFPQEYECKYLNLNDIIKRAKEICEYKIRYNSVLVHQAFCFLRCVDLLGREWVEAKIREMGK